MNPNDQQPGNPDYSFITNDTNPAAAAKKPKKAMVIIIVGLVALLLLVGAVILVKVSEGTATKDKANNVVVSGYLKKISTGDYAGAYELFSSSYKETQTMEQFSTITGPNMKSSIDATKCELGLDKSNPSKPDTIAVCPKSGGGSVGLRFTQDDTGKIMTIVWKNQT